MTNQEKEILEKSLKVNEIKGRVESLSKTKPLKLDNLKKFVSDDFLERLNLKYL